MSLEELCLKQEELIKRQSEIIRSLLSQVLQLQGIVEEDLLLSEDDNK